jgi:hypothetical protein
MQCFGEIKHPPEVALCAARTGGSLLNPVPSHFSASRRSSGIPHLDIFSDINMPG